MVPLGISLGHRLANYLYSPPISHVYRKERLPNKQPKDCSIQTSTVKGVAVVLRIVPQTIRPLSHAKSYENKRWC